MLKSEHEPRKQLPLQDLDHPFVQLILLVSLNLFIDRYEQIAIENLNSVISQIFLTEAANSGFPPPSQFVFLYNKSQLFSVARFSLHFLSKN